MIVCDHAGRAVPQTLGTLGLPAEAFERHIAWDIGAGEVGLRLGRALDAPVVQQRYSRLVIDCNRAPERADAIVAVSDGTEIPANAALSPAAAAVRVAEVHAPYHRRIAEVLDARAAAGLSTVVVAIHSFTPWMNGVSRPWAYGVLHLGDSPLSAAMLAELASEPGLAVGDNEPYAMDGVDYTVPAHAIARGLDYLELEIRQDLIADEAGQAAAAARLARLVTRAAARISG
ncbi:N-formylglutamate amidohydrolase [Phenylobacterium sp.]|uniref:N-formylglutamate amidohydrolase n=1 Tax=Phenylobacterium sp. TaxID=1871053 RepID=UPI002F4279F9